MYVANVGTTINLLKTQTDQVKVALSYYFM